MSSDLIAVVGRLTGAGVLHPVMGTVGGPCFAAWTGGDRVWLASRRARQRRAGGGRSDYGPTIIAELEGGPLAGRRLEAAVVEGRPPKTLDVQADDGSTCRYCLAEWTQAGPTAVYTFLYPV